MNRARIAPLVLAAWIWAGGALARSPVVVELYTAQGCASCGTANAFVASLADRPGVMALTLNVDYWDYLGWKDTFARPEFSDRQHAYDKRFGLRDVYTPQIVVDGRAQASGDKPAEVEDLIATARRADASAPAITPHADGGVAVERARRPIARGGDDVWLVRFDPRVQDVAVRDGDNRGQTVTHRNAVRQLVRLGAWTGAKRVFHVPTAPEDGLSTLILVQGPKGGRIAAARLIAG